MYEEGELERRILKAKEEQSTTSNQEKKDRKGDMMNDHFNLNSLNSLHHSSTSSLLTTMENQLGS